MNDRSGFFRPVTAKPGEADMKDDRLERLLAIVGMPIVLASIAVGLGILRPLIGVLAAIVLMLQVWVGRLLGRVIWSWPRSGRRGFMFWIAFCLGVGLSGGIGIARVGGLTGGILFGVALTGILTLLGRLETIQHRRSN